MERTHIILAVNRRDLLDTTSISSGNTEPESLQEQRRSDEGDVAVERTVDIVIGGGQSGRARERSHGGRPDRQRG